MIEGALIFLAGLLFGRLMPARRLGTRAPKAPKPICGCEHNLALHDPKTGICHATEETGGEPILSPGKSYIIGYRDAKQVPCTCKQYVGPKPAELYFSTPLMLPESTDE